MSTIPFNPESKPGFGRRGGRGDAPREPLGKLFDKSPPNSAEAEMSLLGSMLLDPRVITDVMQIVRGPESFYSDAHGEIYRAIVELADKHNAMDLVLLVERLKDRGVLEAVGGASYLEKLAFETPTAVNAPHFARIVTEKHRLRRLIEAASQVLYDVYHAGGAEGEDAKNLVDAAEQRIFEIAQEEQVSDVESLEALLHKEYERLMAFEEGHGAPSGVRTGFHDLDGLLSGLQPGEMILLAARPSMGKTALVLNLAEQIAMGTSEPGSTRPERARAPVGIFSLEMSKSSLAQRFLSAWTGIASQKLRSGALSGSAQNNEYAVAFEATKALGQAPIFVDDTPGLTVMGLRARARRMVAQHGVKCLMIDYLQLLSSPAQAKESRQVEVSAISRGLKALARELNVPIIALSQLNRGAEQREGNRPRLSDLRESGSLEQDADVVLLLHREAYYHVQDEDWKANNPDKLNLAEIIIAKQRNGPTDVVRLTWNPETTRFCNHTGAEPSGYVPPPAPMPRPAPPAPPVARAYVQPPPAGGGGAGVGGFHPGRATGPVENHRDGGGPDRDDDAGDEPAPF